MSMPSPAQTRAARAFLAWSMLVLADKARVSVSTIKRYEDGRGTPGSIGAIRDAFETEGISFQPDDGEGMGVRYKPR